MWVHTATYGDPFANPATQKITEDQRVLVGTPLETKFYPLNFPLQKRLVTGPDHPFPSMFKVPLETMQGFGAPFITLALAGLLVFRRQTRFGVALLLWLAPIPLFLMSMVQIDYQKLSYVLLACAPLPFLAGAAAGELDLGPRARAALAVALALLLVLAPPMLRYVELPVDGRKHADYYTRGDEDLPERGVSAGAHADFDWTRERTRLTTGRLLPSGLRDFDPLWARQHTGMQLLRRARLAQWSGGDTEPLPNPIVIWETLKTGAMDHRFLARTTAAPGLAPEWSAGQHGGGCVFAVELAAPAPTLVRVRFRQAGHAIHLSVDRDGDLVDEARWLTLLLVQTSNDQLERPTLTIDGHLHSTTNLTQWTRPSLAYGGQAAGRWVPEPRLFSSRTWRLIAGAEGSLVPAPGDPVRPWDLAQLPELCDDGSTRLVQRCRGDGTAACERLLLSAEGGLLALRTAPPGDLVLAVGAQYPAPAGRHECARQLMAEEAHRSQQTPPDQKDY